MLATSARTGEGIDELRDEIARRVRAKKVTRARLEADVRQAAVRLHDASGTSAHPELSKARIAALDDALAEAAGVPTVVGAVESATRLRANRATGWPVTAWVSGSAPTRSSGCTSTWARTASLHRQRAHVGAGPTQVQRAAVDSEVRAVADEVSAPLTRPWAESVRRASVSRLPDLNDRLDSALAATDLDAGRVPVWAGLVRVLQWLLLLAAVAGAVWLGVLATDRYLGVSEPSTPDVAGVPVPTVMLLGGIVLGIVLSLLCRILVSATARSRARSADRRLRAAIAEVADDLVVAPVRAELAAYDEVREGLGRALK